MELDHVVLWVEDLSRALDFYERVVGMKAVNGDAVRAGSAAMASLRVSPTALIDLAPKFGAEFLASVYGGDGSTGNRVHHLCLAFEPHEYHALKARLAEAKVELSSPLPAASGARGPSKDGFYFQDLDGNVLEARVYG